MSPLEPLAAICAGTGSPSQSKVSPKDYVNPFSGDKSKSWKIPLHLLRNSNTFHSFGSVFVGHFSWHQIPLYTRDALVRLQGIGGAGSEGRQDVCFLLCLAV